MLSEALWSKRNLECVKEMERKPKACFTPRTNLFYLHHLFLLNGSPLFHFTSTETNGNIFGELF